MNTATPWPPPTLLPPVRPPTPEPRVRSRGVAKWIGRSVVLGLIGVSLLFDRSALVVVPLLFVLVVPFEKMFPRHRGQRLRRPGVSMDLGYALASPVLGALGIVVAIIVGIVSLAWLPGLALRPVVALLPASISPFVGIALFDMASYWVHRWSHEVPFLWRFHSVHHSTEHLDWVSGFRNHPFDGAIVAPPFFLLIAAGFDATFTGVLAIVQLVTGLFLHANVRWHWKPLHRLVITPEFHHWHHANEADAHNHNYSIFLPLWDTIFGTYFMPNDRRPQRYGVDDDMPMDMLGQLRFPIRDVDNPVSAAWWAAHHPILSLRRVVHFGRMILGDVWRSTRRPVRARTR